MSLPVWLSGPMFFLGGVWCHFLSGLMFLRGGGLCQEGLSVRGGSTSREMPQYWYLVLATKAGGTHPTGLHSCSTMYCKYLPHIWMVMKGLFWPLYGNWCWNWCGSQIFQNSLPRINTLQDFFVWSTMSLFSPLDKTSFLIIVPQYPWGGAPVRPSHVVLRHLGMGILSKGTLPEADPEFLRRWLGGGQPLSLEQKPFIWQDLCKKTA